MQLNKLTIFYENKEHKKKNEWTAEDTGEHHENHEHKSKLKYIFQELQQRPVITDPSK